MKRCDFGSWAPSPTGTLVVSLRADLRQIPGSTARTPRGTTTSETSFRKKRMANRSRNVLTVFCPTDEVDRFVGCLQRRGMEAHLPIPETARPGQQT